MLVAVDDLQWLDPPSAAALEFALRRLGRLPVGVLACQRLEGELDPAPRLTQAFPADRFMRLELGRLDQAAVREIVKAAAGRPLPRRVLLRIERTADGNPFFALELARSLPLDLLEFERLALPGTLRALVEARVAGLAPRVRDVLLAAAVVRTPDAAIVAALTRRSFATVRRALEQAESARIVALDRSEVRFVHPLYVAGVYANASQGDRRRLHRRAAEVVAESEERARHLALAATAADAALARALEDAAESARARGAPESAAELVEEARRLTPAADVVDAQRRAIQAPSTGSTQASWPGRASSCRESWSWRWKAVFARSRSACSRSSTTTSRA